MNKCRLLAVLVLGASLSACGGNETRAIDCTKELKYQNRTVGKRVVAPEGLDQLDQFREMPIPEADPEAPSAGPNDCGDKPPTIMTTG